MSLSIQVLSVGRRRGVEGEIEVEKQVRRFDHPPFVINRLDDEPQCRADGIDVLVHDPLDNRRLPRIVESPSDNLR